MKERGKEEQRSRGEVGAYTTLCVVGYSWAGRALVRQHAMFSRPF